MRIETAGDGQEPAATLWDAQQAQFIHLYPSRKEALPGPTRAELEQSLESSRKSWAVFGAPKEEPELELKPAERAREVGGWRCLEYQATRAGRSATVCLIPWDEAPVPKSAFVALDAIAAHQMLQRQASHVIGRRPVLNLVEDLTALPGLPVSISEQGAPLHTLVEAAVQPIPPSTFEVPAGYSELR